MMKSVLSIVQNFRYRTNLSAPTTLIGSTDPDVLQLVHLLNAVCEELRQAKVWAVQKKRHSFSTVSGQANYVLPQDFYSQILRTQWNQTENNPLIGPSSDAMFNCLLYGNSPSSINYTYRIFGSDTNPNSSTAGNDSLSQFEVSPTPSSVQTLSFDYISRDLYKPKNWEPSTAYNGSGTPVLVNSAGYNYQTVSNGTSGTVAPSGTANFTDNNVTWTLVSTPFETITADTDLCIFDYDLVQLGLRAKWFEDHSGDYEQAKAEFEGKISKAVARYKGSFVGSMTRSNNSIRYSVPYRNWSI